MRVAYQGERGAFSESAVRRLMGEAATLPLASFEEMFDAVRTGQADCCVTPIENSLAGSIHRNYDLLHESDLTILGETHLRIVHNLLATPGTSIAALRRVYSHPVALAQCGRFLREHPAIEAVPVHDTAGAVRMVMERGDGAEAAIASHHAAAIYGAATLAAGIEDHAQNFTRFFLAAPSNATLRPIPDGEPRRWKTSLLLHIANQPGALFRALGAFALRDIDLSKIESRPIEGHPWEYAFYLDIIGNAADPPLAGALDSLRQIADSVKVLGTYPTRW
ncbi:MAG: prephenate dehydratase [Acidobacteriota bacterium]|jgi:prephenate dehydratase|nr:prephenate dehydratase [Acidobacteriota bacterium]